MNDRSTESFFVDSGQPYFDFAGNLQSGGRVGEYAQEAVIVNAYQGEELLGSLVFEHYQGDAVFLIQEHKLKGPYFARREREGDFLLLHTLFVLPERRGQGLMRLLLEAVQERWAGEMAVYVNQWQNAELGRYFQARHAPS